MAIYFPDPAPAPPATLWFPGGRDVTFTTEDGLTLTAWLIPASGADRRTAVLLAPGNGGNRAGRVPMFAALAERGFTVFALDYRGYGGNPGRPSEEGLAADARAAAAYLCDAGFPPDRTIYVGESLGTGVVVRLATTHPPAGIALRSPYTSLAALAAIHVAFLPLDGVLVDRFALLDDLAGLDVPTTVIYGTADDIVPAKLSVQVAGAAPRLQEELRLPGVGHNDAIMFGPVVADAVVRLADATIGRDS